ncbi:MAG: DEAD/DEAH box helicase [Flavobacteriales bacterium]|nr:DEAD/DEAH box helicase [Flavobacteriales bacterium]MDP4731434.1 DEAD/DEAH box helicase [Flavobacteriales bacterium]MDP4818947.1 DEAD/DEAH box helicase [Flavobacteriales bacterium]MDP4951496.1 DEAD/DEAH box helicase [Flavobacteriales bacterium]
MTFEELKLTRQFLDAVNELGYESPSEIQEKVIPRVLGGQDVIGIAQTGTGKTAAYVLPLLQLLKYPQGDEPRALILVPTKELVVQVEEQIQSLCKYTELRYVALYGGVGPKTQIEAIKKGVDIIVATPGRFLEIYAKRVIIPKKIKHVVLDECDRMMDMGFWPQLREIQEKLPQKKQQLLFSATFPERVERIADNFLLFPSRVEVTPQATPATTVEQRVYMVPNFKTKLNLLMHLLEGDEMKRVMVFVRTKADATSMGKFMERSNVGEIRFLHSNIGQNSRMNAIKDFKEGNVRILVSTDVTARGIDVFEVSHVVNFQVPGHYEDYVHRIGRTGRAFKTGVAISFVDQSEEYHLTNIQKIIRQTIPVFEIPEVVHIEKTEPEEKQEQAREIDRQKRLDDPDFKGAFHEKKSLQAKMKFKQERDKKQRRSR